MLRKNNRGFSLIELIVVIAIIGILVMLAAPRLLGYTEKARVARIQNDVKVVEGKVAEEYINADYKFDGDIDSQVLEDMIGEKTIYAIEGKVQPGKVEIGNYKIVEVSQIKEAKTKLTGIFYNNAQGKVYYVDEKADTGSGDIGGDDEEEEIEVGENILEGINFDSVEHYYVYNDMYKTTTGKYYRPGHNSYMLYDSLDDYIGHGVSNAKYMQLDEFVLTNDGNVLKRGNGDFGYSYDLISGISNAVKIVGGNKYVIALTNSGDVYSWGDDNLDKSGVMGQGDIFNISTPTKIEYFNNLGIKIIDIINDYHNQTFYITSTGDVYVSGYSSRYIKVLGLTGASQDYYKVTTPTKINELSNIKKISVGSTHVLALDNSGKVYVWGEDIGNQYGHLGPIENTSKQYTPVMIQNIDGIVDVLATPFTSLLLKNDGTIYYWGDVFHLGLYDDEQANELYAQDIFKFQEPQSIKIKNASKIYSTPNGNNQNYVVLLTNGQLWGWGVNNQGDMMRGHSSPVYKPVRIGLILEGYEAPTEGSGGGGGGPF